MKRTSLLLSFMFVLVAISNAQIPKGSLWLGGNIGISHSEDETATPTKQTDIVLSPAIGLAVKQNSIVGLQFNLTQSKGSSLNFESKRNYVGGAIFYRQYWQLLNKLAAFAHFSVGYTDLHDETESQATPGYHQEVDGWSVSLSASPGISYAISRKIQLESSFSNLLNLGYTKKTTVNTNSSVINTFDSHSLYGGIALDNVSYFNLGFRLLITK